MKENEYLTHMHSDTYRQDLLWPFVVLIGCSAADEWSASRCFQVVGQSFRGVLAAPFGAEVMPQGYVTCPCVNLN